jgi:NADPH:quinone reductase-like Zn-dependent oxidoreductase
MKQVRFEKFGVPSQVVRCVEVPDVGEPTAWEVVVDILAFGVNPSDIAILAGQYGALPPLPATPGMDGVGRVVKCGASVSGLAVGDHVLMVGNETWTQRRRVAAGAVYKVPAHLDAVQLALLKVNPATALLLLRAQVNLARGDWVLQTAPLSSVGRAVMQMARKLGLRTVNVVRRPENKVLVKAAGGDAVVEDGADLAQAVQAATGGASIRLALDAVGGAGIARLAGCVARKGTIVNYGMLSREAASIGLDHLIFKGVTLKGFWLSDVLTRMTLKERDALFGELTDLLAEGVLKAEVAGTTFAIDEIAAAIRLAEQTGRSGKVVVFPNGPIVA